DKVKDHRAFDFAESPPHSLTPSVAVLPAAADGIAVAIPTLVRADRRVPVLAELVLEIAVPGGIAGAVLAARSVAEPGRRLVLIEVRLVPRRDRLAARCLTHGVVH